MAVNPKLWKVDQSIANHFKAPGMSACIHDSNNIFTLYAYTCMNILVFIVRLVTEPLAVASAAIWNVPKKKETTGEPSRLLGRPRKAAAVDNRNNVSAVRKQLLVASATTSREQEWRYHKL